jgi:ribosomal protein L22
MTDETDDTPRTPEPEETAVGESLRSRRRRKSRRADASADAPASGVEGEDVVDGTPEDVVDETPEDVVDATPEDVEAEEAAADVMLEADAEAEGENEAQAEAEAEADEEALADLEQEPEEAEEEAPPPAPAPAPTRRRRGERGERRDVVVRAQAKYVRSSARKARLVCDHIRGKSVEEARAILAHTSRAVARDWSKLLESAVANAENNHELVGEDLYVKAVHADEGPTIRRFRPRAMGRATRIRKRTSHLTILLTPKD